jgi:DNA-binding SARP family transcriptional activator
MPFIIVLDTYQNIPINSRFHEILARGLANIPHGSNVEPWMVSIRERLRNKVLRMIKRCGSYYEQSGEFENALEIYQKGLEVDDLIEEFCRRMMKCYYRLGRRAEALSVYKRCFQVLSSVLGINPSEETEALARELKQRRKANPVKATFDSIL